MYCPDCGHSNNESNTFCMKCGKNLKETSENNFDEKISESKYNLDYVSDKKNYIFSFGFSIVGALLCILGCILPFVSINLGFINKSVKYIDGDGKIVCGIMGLAILFSILKYQKLNIITSTSVLIILGIYLFHLFDGESSEYIGGFIQLEIGFYLIIIGAVVLLIGAIAAFKGNWDKTSKKAVVIFCVSIAGIALIITMYLLVFKYKVFCSHQWKEATCSSPQICSKCEKTQGEKLEHIWIDADCENPETCSLCGETGAAAFGHEWIAATCETAKKCMFCAKTEGTAKGHDWLDATYESPKTCSVCGDTQGEPLSDIFNDDTWDEPLADPFVGNWSLDAAPTKYTLEISRSGDTYYIVTHAMSGAGAVMESTKYAAYIQNSYLYTYAGTDYYYVENGKLYSGGGMAFSKY